MQKKRAIRRYATHNKLKKIFKIVQVTSRFDMFESDLLLRSKRLRDNMKNCSCSMCCNPRHNGWSKSEQRTMQERKSIDKFNESLLYDINLSNM